MRQFCTSGSVGAAGGQPPAATRARDGILNPGQAQALLALSLAKTRSEGSRPSSCSIGAIGHGPQERQRTKNPAERSVTAVECVHPLRARIACSTLRRKAERPWPTQRSGCSGGGVRRLEALPRYRRARGARQGVVRARPSRERDACARRDSSRGNLRRRRRRCRSFSTITWSRSSRLMVPITRSAKGFCHGERGVVRTSARPMAFTRCRNCPPKMPSRSRMRNRGAESWGKASTTCCAVQAAVGESVTLKCTTRRR